MAKTIRQSNIREFFNFAPINARSIKPGMLLSFKYSSPDGVHDPTPLIYVLSTEGDRVWGMNIHYNFTLMAQIYNSKQIEVNAEKKNIKPTTQTPNANPKGNEDVLNKVPRLKNVLSKTKTKPSLKVNKQAQKAQQVAKVSSKQFALKTSLDIFSLYQRPDYILRNYLFTRMKSGQKLIYKVS